MYFTYLDILRRVRPSTVVAGECSFVVLGSFDTVKVVTGLNSIYEMNRIHEERQKAIDASLDRQPVFLASLGKEYHPQNNVLDPAFKEDWPLVLTVFQLNKPALARYPQGESISCIIGIFDEAISEYKNTHVDFHCHWETFWNLGESDIAVAFRVENLWELAKLQRKLRTQIFGNSELYVLSSSSHCAFPFVANSSEEKISQNLQEWLKREITHTDFFTLFNTSFIDQSMLFDVQLNGRVRFLYGEWDDAIVYDLIQPGELNKLAKQLCSNIFAHVDDNGRYMYKAAYTIPVAKFFEQDTQQQQITIPQKMTDTHWISTLLVEFSNFAEFVRNRLGEYYGTEKIEDITVMLESIGNSMVSIAKYLYRLYVGRFEQDIYSYIKSVFDALPFVLQGYRARIEKCLGAYTSNRSTDRIIFSLVDELIHDSAELITTFQHMFTVLAVSPYTLIETYGSSMRALAAADKLFDAYQGIIAWLKHNFPDIINTSTIGHHDILIVPYQMASSVHTLFFEQATMSYRISKIDIDYMKMFDIKSMVYLVLHECGHHLGNRERDKRRPYVVKACIMAALEKQLGIYLNEPFEVFVKVLRKKIDDNVEEKLFHDVPSEQRENIKAKISQKIQASVVIFLNKLTDEIYDLAEKEPRKLFENSQNCSYENVCIEASCSSFLMNYAVYIIQNIFYDSDADTENSGKREFWERFIEPYEDYLKKSFTEIADILLFEIVQVDGDVYEASRIKTAYESGVLLNKMSGYIRKNAASVVWGTEIKETFAVFADIFADMFALKILQLRKPHDYYKMFLSHTGSKVNEAASKRVNLMRIIAVTSYACDNTNDYIDTPQPFLDVLKLAEPQQELVRQQWRKINNSCCLEYLLHYAEVCALSMDKMLNSISYNSEKQGVECLNDMFFHVEETQKCMDSVYYFWRYLFIDEERRNDLLHNDKLG